MYEVKLNKAIENTVDDLLKIVFYYSKFLTNIKYLSCSIAGLADKS